MSIADFIKHIQHHVSCNTDTGGLAEVDLFIPPALHDKFNEYPPAPTKMTVDPAYLSQQQQNAQAQSKTFVSSPKLVPTLLTKERYVLHWNALMAFIEMGCVVTRLHSALSYYQEDYVRPFAQYNISKRSWAKLQGNSLLEQMLKSMTNHLYGKFAQNKRCYINIKVFKLPRDGVMSTLLTNRLRRCIARNDYQRFVSFDNLVVVQRKQRTCILTNPIYAATAILDKSKIIMYDLFYNHLQPHFGIPNLKLLYTDTDSFYLLFKNCPNIYVALRSIEERVNGGKPITEAGQGLFDWSTLNPSSPFFTNVNVGQAFKFKDEVGDGVITEVIALRAKMYSITQFKRDPTSQQGWKQVAKLAAKGVPRECHKDLDFLTCLLTNETQRVTFRRIIAKKLQLYTQTQVKVGVSSWLFNDKRYLTRHDDSTQLVESYAIGHKHTL